MRRLLGLGAALALLAADALPASAAEPSAKGAEVRSDGAASAPWYRRIFGASSKSKTPPKEVARPKPKEVAAKTLQEERALYLQRITICDRLKEIAIQTDNDALLKQADTLSVQAWDLYNRKVAHLPGTQLTGTEAEDTLSRRLSPGVDSRSLRTAIKDAKGATASRDAFDPDGDKPRSAQASTKREE